MRLPLLLIAVHLLSLSVLNAQKISGTAIDVQGSPLKGATLSLLRSADSAIVKLAVSKDDGQYTFTDIKSGSYKIKATHVGYQPIYSDIVNLADEDVTVPRIQLSKENGKLAGITVTAQKPMVEVRADKTVLNVEGTINSVGTDALELLRKSPGVTVDKDDNINVSGKNGVQIYVDGRPTPLSGQDLANYLKSLQSSQIESIEIISNPSAKYDAAGNAGIINIRLKKNKAYGTNGSVNAGWNIGKYAKYNGG